jgi:transposase
MPKTYSGDLRERVVEAVASGASRREAAELYEIAASTAVKWLQRLRETGSAAAKPRRQHLALGGACGGDPGAGRGAAGCHL